MSVLKGYAGSIKAGSTPTAVGEVRSYTLNQSADVQETTTLGSGWAKNTATIKRWSVSLEAHFDISDGGQDELRSSIASGSSIALELYLGGESGVGNTSYTGNAVIESMDISNDVAGIVTVSISATGDGALTETALA